MKIPLVWQLVVQFLFIVGQMSIAEPTLFHDPRWHKMLTIIISAAQSVFAVAGSMTPSPRQAQEIVTLKAENKELKTEKKELTEEKG